MSTSSEPKMFIMTLKYCGDTEPSTSPSDLSPSELIDRILRRRGRSYTPSPAKKLTDQHEIRRQRINEQRVDAYVVILF